MWETLDANLCNESISMSIWNTYICIYLHWYVYMALHINLVRKNWIKCLRSGKWEEIMKSRFNIAPFFDVCGTFHHIARDTQLHSLQNNQQMGDLKENINCGLFFHLPPPPFLANIMLCFMEMDQNATCAVNTELWSSFKSYFSPHIVFFWNKPPDNFRTWFLRPKHHPELPASLGSSFSRWLPLPHWPCTGGKIRSYC